MSIKIDFKSPYILIKYPFSESINSFLFSNKYYAFWNSKDKHREININKGKLSETIDKIDYFISFYTDKGFIFNITDEYTTFVKKSQGKNTLNTKEKKKRKSIKDLLDVDLVIPDLKIDLFPYQKVGVSFIEEAGGSAMIFDTPGLGKTAQSIGYVVKNNRRAVVVCPASLKYNWQYEIEKFTDATSFIIDSKMKDKKLNLRGYNFIIINYDIVGKFTEYLKDDRFDTIILDECHAIKSYKAKRTQNILDLKGDFDYKVLLTGTPLLNRPQELFTLLNFIRPEEWNSFWPYAERYCNLKRMPWGMDYSGSSNEKELHEMISPYYIRRKKEEVLKDLPEKIQTEVVLDLSRPNRTTYNRVMKDYIRYLLDEKEYGKAKKAQFNEQLVKLNALKHVCIEDKMEKLDDFLEEFVENNNKVLIFSQYSTYVDKVVDRYPELSVKLTGSMSPAERNKSVNIFKEDKDILFFVGTIGAAGVGLTLTEADTVIFLDLPWTPAELGQAEDRAHRIGTKNAVNVYYLMSRDTIEFDIKELLDKKRNLADVILDGADMTEDTSKDIVTELNNGLIKKNKK